MRLSRVPVLSLYQHDLVYDPGGLCPVSPITTGQILRSSGVRLSAVPTPRIRPPGAVIPCGTTTFKQLSRLDTDPADLLHPASDVCLLAPAGFATGLVASLCPWKDLHLLDNLNRFHRGSHPRIPSVTSLARHDTPLLALGRFLASLMTLVSIKYTICLVCVLSPLEVLVLSNIWHGG